MTWLQRLWRRNQMERQLEKELRFHLEQHTADLIAQGLNPREARRQARLALGGEEQVKEQCRDARGTRWLEDLWQDLRYALRTLRQRPGFAVVALATLALGCGATTVMFTLIDGVLLKPLQYSEPGQLVAVHGRSKTWNVAAFGEQYLAYKDFLDCKHDIRSVALTGWLFNAGTVSAPGDPAYANQFEIASDLFSVLGVGLLEGRAFTTDEDRPGGTPVAILGYSFWRDHFGGRPDTVGSTLVFDGKRYTIVGIARPEFRLDDNEADIFTPVGQDTARYLQTRNAHPFRALGRLHPGAKLSQAQSELTVIASHLASQYPDTNKGRDFFVGPLRLSVGNVRSTLWLLLGAVGLVLLIACANVASLLLARAISRERELAVRVALGAGRGRLVRQCLTESAVLALGGGALGVVLAVLSIRPFISFWPGGLPRAQDVHLDWRVLLFTVVVSLASGLLFGLAPALRAPAKELEETLRAGSRSVVGSSRRLHSVFVISEIALAAVLLVSAGMLGRTLLRLSTLDPGVNIQNLLITRMALSPAVLKNPAQTRAAWQDVLNRAGRVPGVEAIATVDTVPMRAGNNQLNYSTTAALAPENLRPMALANSVSPGYFKVMGIPLRQGRLLDEHDRIGGEMVVVIDEVMAQHAFPGQNALGKLLWIPDMWAAPVKVAGVVGHVRHWGFATDDQAQVRDQFYYAFAQVPDPMVRRWSELMSIAVRTSVPPLSLVPALRRELRGDAGDQVLYQVRTMEQLARNTLSRQRFLLLLFAIFGGLALALACIGIYGVLAYLTSQRTPEIGVRIALGASAGEVLRMVMKQSFGMVAVGVAAGAAGAWAAGRVLVRLVEGMGRTEPFTYALMISLLVMAALAASFLPARRASRVDPVRALRQE